MESVEAAEYVVNSFNENGGMPMASEPGHVDVNALEIRFHGPKGAPPSDNLYVKGLPIDASEDEVRLLFGEYGNVVSIKVMTPRPGAYDCTALVRMSSVEEAEAAVNSSGGGAGQSQRSE